MVARSRASRKGSGEARDDRDVRERERLSRQARQRDDRERERRGSRRRARVADNVDSVDRVADRVANDVNALVRAWSAANAETFKGVVTVAGNLVLDLFGGGDADRPRRDRGPSRRRAGRPRADDWDEDETDEDDRGRRRSRTIDDIGDDVGGVAASMSDALAEAASVVARSSRRFQDEYDSALDEGADFDRRLGRPLDGGEEDEESRDPRRRSGAARDMEDAGADIGAAAGDVVDAVVDTDAPSRRRKG